MSVTELAQAVTLQEAGRLTKVPGIGKKTAERLLLELRDRLPKTLATGGTRIGGGERENDAASDIMNALLALGYNEREALSAMKGLAPDTSVSDGIRAALKLLSKSS
jgi:Holliday junction DNA helicase RuvA